MGEESCKIWEYCPDSANEKYKQHTRNVVFTNGFTLKKKKWNVKKNVIGSFKWRIKQNTQKLGKFLVIPGGLIKHEQFHGQEWLLTDHHWSKCL